MSREIYHFNDGNNDEYFFEPLNENVDLDDEFLGNCVKAIINETSYVDDDEFDLDDYDVMEVNEYGLAENIKEMAWDDYASVLRDDEGNRLCAYISRSAITAKFREMSLEEMINVMCSATNVWF